MPQQLTTTPHHGSLQPQLLATQLRENTDNSKRDILREAKKIVGISPIIEDDLEYLMSKGTHKDRVLMVTANDFLKYEMKISDTDIEDLHITMVTRSKKGNSN